MRKIGNGGMAFPGSYTTSDFYGRETVHVSNGMSLRDYFAGQALVALGTWMPSYSNGQLANTETMAQRALLAYQQADAMIAARHSPSEHNNPKNKD